MHPQSCSRNHRRARATTLLTCTLAFALSGCASYWQSNHRSWRSDEAEASDAESGSLHGSSAQAQQYGGSSPFVTAGNDPNSQFGRNMGVREFESDWTYTERPAVPNGFSAHQRMQRLSFAVGATNLDREAHGALMQVRDQLKANTRWHLLVVGMTDRDEEQGLNPGRLSDARAQTVKTWLVQQGIDADRITTAGFGSRYAVGDQFQPMTKRSDRRVEIWAFM
jgi:outer membrane protein OmpA-like peptidoglycan-associated protein